MYTKNPQMPKARMEASRIRQIPEVVDQKSRTLHGLLAERHREVVQE